MTQTEEEKLASTLPKLTYNQALQKWFIAPGGSVCQIGTADIADLIFFLASSSVGMKQKITRRDLLAMLEADSTSEMRWYCLLEFKRCKSPMKLYDSEEDAREAHKASQILYNAT